MCCLLQLFGGIRKSWNQRVINSQICSSNWMIMSTILKSGQGTWERQASQFFVDEDARRKALPGWIGKSSPAKLSEHSRRGAGGGTRNVGVYSKRETLTSSKALSRSRTAHWGVNEDVEKETTTKWETNGTDGITSTMSLPKSNAAKSLFESKFRCPRTFSELHWRNADPR